MRISDWSSDVCSSDLPPGGTLAAVDPDMPDPAVVAAARTRTPNPVEAIKADVATRLAPKTGNARGAATVAGAAHPPSAARSGERRVGKECVSKFEHRRSPDYLKEKNKSNIYII